MEHAFYLLASSQPVLKEHPSRGTPAREMGKKSHINLISLLYSISKFVIFRSFQLHIVQYPSNPVVKSHLKNIFLKVYIEHFPPYFLKWAVYSLFRGFKIPSGKSAMPAGILVYTQFTFGGYSHRIPLLAGILSQQAGDA
jgi:hypothetical protein